NSFVSRRTGSLNSAAKSRSDFRLQRLPPAGSEETLYLLYGAAADLASNYYLQCNKSWTPSMTAAADALSRPRASFSRECHRLLGTGPLIPKRPGGGCRPGAGHGLRDFRVGHRHSRPDLLDIDRLSSSGRGVGARSGIAEIISRCSAVSPNLRVADPE